MFSFLKFFKKKSEPELKEPSELDLLKSTIDAMDADNEQLFDQNQALQVAYGLLQAEYNRQTVRRNSLTVMLVASMGLEVKLDAEFMESVSKTIDEEDLTVWYEDTDDGGMIFKVMSRGEAELEQERLQKEVANGR